MEDDLSDSMLGWFFFGLIAILSSVVISLIFSKFYGHSSFIPFYVGSFVVLGSFLFTVTAVLYRSFKKEQEHLMNILQKK